MTPTDLFTLGFLIGFAAGAVVAAAIPILMTKRRLDHRAWREIDDKPQARE